MTTTMNIEQAKQIAESLGYTVNINSTIHGDKQIEVRDKYGLTFRYWDFEPNFAADLKHHVSLLTQQGE